MTNPDSETHIYRLKSDGLNWLQSWRRYGMRAILQILLLLAGIYIVRNLYNKTSIDSKFALNFSIYLALCFFALSLMSLFSYRRNIDRLRSYELHISDNTITQQMGGVPTLTFTRDEITQIIGTKQGIIICTSSPNKRIVIWPSTENYEDIWSRLSEWQMITKPERFSILRLPRGILSIVMLISILSAFWSNAPIIVLPSAVLSSILLVSAIIELPRHSKVLRSGKIFTGLGLLIILILVVIRLWVVFSS